MLLVTTFVFSYKYECTNGSGTGGQRYDLPAACGCRLLVNQHDSLQGGHSSGKPGKVRELKSCQGKVRENKKNQGKVRENELLQLFSCRDYCSDNNR